MPSSASTGRLSWSGILKGLSGLQTEVLDFRGVQNPVSPNHCLGEGLRVILYCAFGRPFIRKTHHKPLLPSLTRYSGEDSDHPATLRKFICHVPNAPPRRLRHVPNVPAACSDANPSPRFASKSLACGAGADREPNVLTFPTRWPPHGTALPRQRIGARTRDRTRPMPQNVRRLLPGRLPHVTQL
jgi:hypothetical protein